MDQLDYIVLAGIACGLFALGSAAFVYRKAKDPRVAGRLALLLVLETIMLWTSLGGPIRWIEPGGVDRFWLRLHFANDGFLIAAYLPAVAVLVPSRLVAPFKSNRAAIAMIALALINAFCVFAFPDFYLPDGEKATRALDVLLDIGPGVAAIYGLLVLSYALGLIATLSARRVAQGPLARRQANALAFAFGARDSSWGLIYIMGLVSMLGGATLIPQPEPGTMSLWLPGLCIGGLTIYVCLLAYGVVSTKLFDIDLRVKWTLERGTIAAIFIAVFFMVSEGTAAILSEQLGNMIGILATGALVFAMAPLQRAAERLSNQAMPSVQDTPEYKNFRKLQVYGEAVAEAMREGAVSPVQRVVLNRLRQQLELDEEEAAALEQELIES